LPEGTSTRSHTLAPPTPPTSTHTAPTDNTLNSEAPTIPTLHTQIEFARAGPRAMCAMRPAPCKAYMIAVHTPLLATPSKIKQESTSIRGREWASRAPLSKPPRSRSREARRRSRLMLLPGTELRPQCQTRAQLCSTCAAPGAEAPKPSPHSRSRAAPCTLRNGRPPRRPHGRRRRRPRTASPRARSCRA